MAQKSNQRYCMRPMELEDVGAVSTWFEHQADLALFDRSAPVPSNQAMNEAGWKDTLTQKEPRGAIWFAIDDSAGEIVGIAGIERVNYTNGDGVLALYLSDSARRKGVALLASGILLDLAFGQLRLNRITSYYRDDNEATRKLTGIAGFSIEGVMRRAWFANGKHYDTIMVGILNEEWTKSRKKMILELNKSSELQFGRAPWVSKAWPDQPF